MEFYVLTIVVGLLLSIALIGIGVTIGRANKRISEKQLCSDNNSNDVHSGDPGVHNSNVGKYHTAVDCGQDLGLNPKAEEMMIHLQVMRALASNTEKETLDYAMECVAVRNMLENFLEERDML